MDMNNRKAKHAYVKETISQVENKLTRYVDKQHCYLKKFTNATEHINMTLTLKSFEIGVCIAKCSYHWC